MPANLAMINGRVAMAYVGETPWHRIGTHKDRFESVEDAMHAAAIDFTVRIEPLYVKLDSKRVFHKIDLKRAVLRSGDDEVLGCVGDDYEPLQNAEAFSVLKPAMAQHGITIDTAGALGRGDIVWMLAKLPESIEPMPGDKVDGYFLIKTGHNGYTAYDAALTPIRVVCSNTLTIALRQLSNRITLRHVKSDMEQMELVTKMVTELVTNLKKTGEAYKKLAAKKWSFSDMRAYINAVVGVPDEATKGPKALKRDAILELTASGAGADITKGTAWGAYNAVTEYVDHVRVGKSVRMLKARDESSMFGLQASMKAKALELALDAVK